jgi:ribonuclease HII
VTDFWSIENTLLRDGWSVVCGVDEAGRGPLAGPVYAAAVILPRGLVIDGLDDSKKLSESTRERLFDELRERAVSFGVASADVAEIDALNILNATFLAMNRAIARLTVTPELALIDGNRASGIDAPHMCVVGGDGRSANIAAASVLAKVSRDRYMKKLALQYPEYGFDRHKGYPTEQHYEMLRRFGPSEVHRKLFLRNPH